MGESICVAKHVVRTVVDSQNYFLSSEEETIYNFLHFKDRFYKNISILIWKMKIQTVRTPWLQMSDTSADRSAQFQMII